MGGGANGLLMASVLDPETPGSQEAVMSDGEAGLPLPYRLPEL